MKKTHKAQGEMEEPHIPTAATETSQDEKQEELDEVSEQQEQLSKPMEVDDDDDAFPTTSAVGDPISESLFESNTPEDSQLMPKTKEAGNAEETAAEVDETIEEVNFEKPTEEALDESISQSTLDYAEKSINISQIIMEHQDDSTDAFDALKRDETDVLNEIKVEINEKPESEPTPMETLELSSPIAVDDENPSSSLPVQADDIIDEVVPKPTEETTITTAEKSIENEQEELSEMETTQTQTEIVDDEEELEKEDLVSDKIGQDVESIQSPAAPDSLEKVTEETEEEETETTNEGKIKFYFYRKSF